MQLDWNIHFGFDPTVGPVPGHVLTWLPPGGKEDIITLTATPHACSRNEVEIGLTSQATDDQVRWWKGLRLLARDGAQLGVSETQDDNHVGAIMVFPANELADKKLEIWKAKFLGIHTGMYDLPLAPLVSWTGTRFIFHWFKDNGDGHNAR